MMMHPKQKTSQILGCYLVATRGSFAVARRGESAVEQAVCQRAQAANIGAAECRSGHGVRHWSSAAKVVSVSCRTWAESACAAFPAWCVLQECVSDCNPAATKRKSAFNPRRAAAAAKAAAAAIAHSSRRVFRCVCPAKDRFSSRRKSFDACVVLASSTTVFAPCYSDNKKIKACPKTASP